MLLGFAKFKNAKTKDLSAIFITSANGSNAIVKQDYVSLKNNVTRKNTHAHLRPIVESRELAKKKKNVYKVITNVRGILIAMLGEEYAFHQEYTSLVRLAGIMNVQVILNVIVAVLYASLQGENGARSTLNALPTLNVVKVVYVYHLEE